MWRTICSRVALFLANRNDSGAAPMRPRLEDVLRCWGLLGIKRILVLRSDWRSWRRMLYSTYVYPSAGEISGGTVPRFLCGEVLAWTSRNPALRSFQGYSTSPTTPALDLFDSPLFSSFLSFLSHLYEVFISVVRPLFFFGLLCPCA